MSQIAEIINFPPRHLARGSAQENKGQDRDSFVARFSIRAEAFSPFCLGIDPSDKILNGVALEDYCAKLTEQIIKEGVALVKPQSAYFERFGSKGIKVLEELIAPLRAAGILVLLDVKRGDIGSTNVAYAKAYFDKDSALCVDALTANAYLGFEDLAPFFAYEDKYVFVVAASSNEAGAKAAAQAPAPLAELIGKIAAELRAGAVIGATRTDITAKTLEPLGTSLLLSPGIGAQGAGFDVFDKFPTKRAIIPTASRSVLEAEDFAEALKQHKEAAAKLSV